MESTGRGAFLSDARPHQRAAELLGVYGRAAAGVLVRPPGSEEGEWGGRGGGVWGGGVWGGFGMAFEKQPDVMFATKTASQAGATKGLLSCFSNKDGEFGLASTPLMASLPILSRALPPTPPPKTKEAIMLMDCPGPPSHACRGTAVPGLSGPIAHSPSWSLYSRVNSFPFYCGNWSRGNLGEDDSSLPLAEASNSIFFRWFQGESSSLRDAHFLPEGEKTNGRDPGCSAASTSKSLLVRMAPGPREAL